MKKIVVALGGNAILTDDPTAQAQQRALEKTAENLAKFIAADDVQLIVTHGNGPQVGNLLLQQLAADSSTNPAMPLDTVGAMTQGEIGLWLANKLNLALKQRHIVTDVATLVTRTEVSESDSAFEHPSKPIGPFYSAVMLAEMQKQHPDWEFKEDAGRGYRRVVASPKPLNILEASAIKSLVESGQILIAAGGGGVPVVKRDDEYVGVEAVIDKDFSAAKLAELVEADELVILTAVKHVSINFNQPNQQNLIRVTVAEAQRYLEEGQFAPGSMKPKIEAAISFVTQTGKRAVITSLDNVASYDQDGAATMIMP